MIEGIILIVCVIVGFAAIKTTGRNDSPVEEMAEAVIEKHTGVDIDLSPGKESDRR